MPVRKILHLGDPLLWEISLPVDNPGADDTQAIIGDLHDTLNDFRSAHGFGRGIAAPQIGILKRIIYVRMPSGEFKGALINPQMTWADERRTEHWDACFSLPNLMVRVSRSANIIVTYTDEQGIRKEITASTELSELLQHEIDHLDGILAIERAISPKAFATYEKWKKHHKDL